MKKHSALFAAACMTFVTGCFGNYPTYSASFDYNTGLNVASSGYAQAQPQPVVQNNANAPFVPVVQPVVVPEAVPVQAVVPAARVFINGRVADPTQLQSLEQRYGTRIPAGQYWYDARSGLAGRIGSGTLAYAPGFDFGPVPRNASNGNSNIVFNGRELPVNEALYVGTLFGIAPAVLPQFAGNYALDATGNLYAADGRWLGNLVALAQQRGRRSYASGDNFWHSNGASGNSQGGCSYVHINNSTDGSITDVSSGC